MVVLIIIAFPLVVLWEVMKMNRIPTIEGNEEKENKGMNLKGALSQ